ncbi:MAG TPA: S49 family peptidase, partial [Pirellulales bacterium]
TLAESQKLVDAFADFMVIDVARGRRISAKRAKAMADGRSHVGASAKALRFIDAVRSLDDVLAELSGKAAPAGTKATATTRSTPTVRAAVDEDDQEFDEDEFDDELDEQDDEDEDEIAMTTATVGNPEQRFKELVNAKVAAGMTRQAATSAVVKANPALHEAYVAAANARIKSRR